MTTQIYVAILTVILFFGCQSKRQIDQEKKTEKDSIKIADSVKTVNVTVDTLKTAYELNDSDCIRGQAAPVIKKAIYPNSSFKLNSDNHTGTETIELKNGDRLVINNWGCEYYVLTFRFETLRFSADTTDIMYWLDKAVVLMTEIEGGLDAPLDTSGGTLATKNYLKNNKDYDLGEEIVYDDDFIRDFVTFDRIQKVDNKRYAIEISYATGPL